MTQQEIQELAGHRQVPAWVVKLVGDCLAKEREQEPVAWRWIPSEVWGTYVLSDDHEKAELAKEHGIKVEPLYTHPQPKVEQEPVAHKDWCIGGDKGPCNCKEEPFGYFRYDIRLDAWVQNRNSNQGVPFYTHPQPKQPLTDEIPKGVLLAISNAGLTLLKTQYGYELQNIGPAVAHGIKGET